MHLGLGRLRLTGGPNFIVLPSGRTRANDPVVVVLSQTDTSETSSCRLLLVDAELFRIRAAIAECYAQIVTQTVALFPIRRITYAAHLTAKDNVSD